MAEGKYDEYKRIIYLSRGKVLFSNGKTYEFYSAEHLRNAAKKLGEESVLERILRKVNDDEKKKKKKKFL